MQVINYYLHGSCKSLRGEVNELTENMKSRIGAWLLEPGHTKKMLAALLGISIGTLANRMGETYDWSWTEIQELTKVLDCKADDLL